MLPIFSYARPKSVQGVIDLLGKGNARLHAGGTDLLGCLRESVFETETVVSLSGIDGLAGITRGEGGGLTIGAMTSVADVSADTHVTEDFTALAEAAVQVASPQLRNQGTIAGNLCQKPRCWYYRGDFECLRRGGEACSAYEGDNRYHCLFGGEGCYAVHPSDIAPALVALGALVRVQGADGRRSIPVERFFVLPGTDLLRETVLADDEIITEVVVPPHKPGLRSSYRKVRVRGAWDFALVSVALALNMDGDTVRSARVVLGGVAMAPWPAREAEKVLAGSRLDAATISRAAEAATAGAEPLEHNAYKIELIKGLITDQLEAME